MTAATFEHRQAAHCESGVIASLLRHAGLPISEAMAFGLSGAIVFAYVPLIRIGNMPLISYRLPPGRIVSGSTSRLGVSVKSRRFRSEDQCLDSLKTHLDNGQAVGLRASIFWLPFFPEEMRFHFNAHNLIVYDYEGDTFKVSDPIFEAPVEINAADLSRARFAKGALAPRGLEFYVESVPEEVEYPALIAKAIRRNANMMLRSPVPIAGVNGIRYVSKRLRRIGASDVEQAKLFAGYMVRMQEEVGTGGGGFRFLYAAFLQESGRLLDSDNLLEASKNFTDVGDEWRRFALYVAKMIKGRMPEDINLLADQLLKIADMEQQAWSGLNAKGLDF